MNLWCVMRLGLLVASLVGLRCPDVKFAEAVAFDYFTFSLQWPVTFCRLNIARCSLSSVPDIWTIHGLWPSNFTGANPRKCSDMFDVSQIPKDVITNMNQIWPNLIKNATNEQLWSTQWKVHGSCAQSVPGVQNIKEYFTKATKLANLYNIKEILEISQITEGNNYTIASIQKAMIHGTNRISSVIVSKAPCALNWLFEIRICFDKQFGIINCPNVTNSTLNLNYPSKGLQSAQALRCFSPPTGKSSDQLTPPIAFLAVLLFLPRIV